MPVWAQDALLAVGVTLVQVQGVLARGPGPGERAISDLAGLGVVLLVVPSLAIAVRRRTPELVLGVAAVASGTYYALDYSDGPGWLALFISLWSLTAYGDGRRSVRVGAGVITLLAVVWLVAGYDVEPPAAVGWVFFRIGAAVMAAAIGESMRARRVITAEALARAELAERTREETARARVADERLRIAREVHDTVAHAVAVINVQSGTTAHVLGREPDRAREALRAIEQTSARALAELRSILGVLRAEDGRDPAPTLSGVRELVKQAGDAGMDVRAQLPDGDEMPGAVGAAVYRIVQESLTNVLRHSGARHVEVVVDQRPDEVEARVTDDGAGAPSDARPGHGIQGMVERCEALGGTLAAGRREGGGFEVRAVIPVGTRHG